MSEIEEATPVYPLALNMERGDIQCTSIEAARERMEAEVKLNTDIAAVAMEATPAQPVAPSAYEEAYADLKSAFRSAGFADPIYSIITAIKAGKVRHITANI